MGFGDHIRLVCVCVCTCPYTLRTWMCVYTCVRVCTYVYVYVMYACVHIRLFTYLRSCAEGCSCTCAYVCRARVYLFGCVHMCVNVCPFGFGHRDTRVWVWGVYGRDPTKEGLE